MRVVYRVCTGLLTVLIAVATASTPVLAKTAPGLQVFPLKSYPVQAPSGSSNGSLTLTNNTDRDQQVTMTTELFKTRNENYEYQFGPGDETQWVHFEDAQVTLVPKEVKVVTYTIDAPANASPGGHYIAIIASLAASSDNEHIIEIKRVASLVYLEISGKLVKHSSIASFSLPWITTKQTVSTEVHIGNQGNSHTRARVLMEARYWPYGNFQELKQLEGLVLPSTVRKLADTIQLPSTPGIYAVTAEYAPIQGGPVTQLGHHIVYLPWWFIITALTALIVGTSFFLRWSIPHAKKVKKLVRLRRRRVDD